MDLRLDGARVGVDRLGLVLVVAPFRVVVVVLGRPRVLRFAELALGVVDRLEESGGCGVGVAEA